MDYNKIKQKREWENHLYDGEEKNIHMGNYDQRV